MTTLPTATADGTHAGDALARTRELVLAVNEDTPAERIAAALNAVAWLKEQAAECQRLLDGALLERIVSTGRDVTVGTVRFYAGDDKDTTCTDPAGLLDALLQNSGGDLNGVVQNFFASDWAKYGAVRQADPALFERFFVVKVEPVLKEGKPVRRLQKLDTKYLK